MRGKRNVRRLALTGGLPEDALLSCPRVMLLGQGSVYVEGQHGVVELGSRRIRLKTQCGVLSICGQALELRELSVDAAMITGERIDTATYGKADIP